MDDEPLIRDVSDTARWMAVYRAEETERPDAAFDDPHARALAGERGERIAKAMASFNTYSWSLIARTYLFDRYVQRLVQHGVDTIVNLAAGLDTRPYRLALPATLRWIEVDLPDILDYKESVLGDATPVCALERVRLDLSNVDGRRGLIDRVGAAAQQVAVLAEGLLIYLMPHEVGALAEDLTRPESFRFFVVDIVSPGLIDVMKKQGGEMTRMAGAPFLFAPAQGASFFEPHGWRPAEIKSILKTAGKLGRLPLTMRMFAMLPDPAGAPGNTPWSGVALLTRASGNQTL